MFNEVRFSPEWLMWAQSGEHSATKKQDPIRPELAVQKIPCLMVLIFQQWLDLGVEMPPLMDLVFQSIRTEELWVITVWSFALFVIECSHFYHRRLSYKVPNIQWIEKHDLLMLHIVYVFSQAMNIIVVFSHSSFACIGSIRMYWEWGDISRDLQ